MDRISIHQVPEKYGFSSIKIVENVKKTFYIAGQTSINDDGEVMYHGDIEAQIRISFQRLEELLRANGANLTHVTMLRAYVLDMKNHFDEYLKVLKEYFPGPDPPASTFIEVSRLALEGLLFEVDAVAAM